MQHRENCGNTGNFLLYRALPIQMYFWEKFWDIWASVVFSDGEVYKAIPHSRGRCKLAYTCWAWHTPGLVKGGRATAYSVLQVASSGA